jgi:hypothetical protein
MICGLTTALDGQSGGMPRSTTEQAWAKAHRAGPPLPQIPQIQISVTVHLI